MKTASCAMCVLTAVSVLRNVGCSSSDTPQSAAALEHQLTSPNTEDRVAAANGLSDHSPLSKSAIDALRSAVTHDSDGFVRVQAAATLLRCTRDAYVDELVPSLLVTLDNPEFATRRLAAYLLGHTGASVHSASVTAALSEAALKDPHSNVRANAVLALFPISVDRAASLEVTRVCIADPDAYVRASARSAASFYEADAAKILPDILARLDDHDAQVRSRAAFALGRIGAAAESTLGSLRLRLGDEDRRVRESVEAAIDKVERAVQASKNQGAKLQQ